MTFIGERLVPSPFVTISKNYFRTGDDSKLGADFTITLNGSLLPHKGTPYTDGSSFTDPTADPIDQNVTRTASGIMSKMAAIRDLFSVDGGLLQIYACDLQDEEIQAYVNIESINFPGDTWVHDANYEVVLKTSLISGTLNGTRFSVFPSGEDAFGPYLKSADESWNVETAEPVNDQKLLQHSYRVTHNISAVGQRVYFPSGGNYLYGVVNKEPWEWAKHYCESKLVANPVPVVFSSGYSSGVLNAMSGYYTAYNHLRSFTVDKTGGSYAVNDTWILSSGNAFEDYTVTVQQSAEDGLTTVAVEGNIQGLETVDYLVPHFTVSTTKWEAASGLWNTVSGNLYNRANLYNGTLHTLPLTSVIGYNRVAGTINYNYTYNDRPSNCITSPLVLSEVIEIQTENPVDIFSNIAVVGRTNGPILQNMNTSTAQTKVLNIQLVLRPSGCTYGPPQNVIEGVNSYISAFSGSLSATQIFRASDTENFSIKGGRYNRTIGFTLGNCN